MADKSKKRRLKNPESVRELALKAKTNEAKPKRGQKAKGAVAKVFSPFRKPLGKVAGPFRAKPFRILGLILLPPYLRSSWREVRLVTWPNRKESRQLTFAVIIFAIIFGVFVSALDWGLEKVFKHILLK